MSSNLRHLMGIKRCSYMLCRIVDVCIYCVILLTYLCTIMLAFLYLFTCLCYSLSHCVNMSLYPLSHSTVHMSLYTLSQSTVSILCLNQISVDISLYTLTISFIILLTSLCPLRDFCIRCLVVDMSLYTVSPSTICWHVSVDSVAYLTCPCIQSGKDP